jgi:predicted DNA-binding helix-hairpin-helix protein
MDAIEQLKVASAQMSFEQDIEHGNNSLFSVVTGKCRDGLFVHPAILPNGQKIKLLKTQLSSACERDCYYCPFRAGRNMRRVTFKPEEFARLFMLLAEKRIAEGLFLSSGLIGGGVRTQDKLIDAADILRHKLSFRGYIHLKIMPGAQHSQIERAMLLANRVSINLEAPNDSRLARLAPHKQFTDELLQPLKWIQEIRQSQPGYKAWNGYWPSSVTQFVAGGAGESDLELLSTTEYLYQQLGLKRAYYSPFSPIPDTPLENQSPTPVIREHRLYQASFLLRDYGFCLEELPFENDGLLPLQTDPKLAWAMKNLSGTPLEVNKAERLELLRIPGIGLKGVEIILDVRRQRRIRDLSMLKKMGIKADKAAPFLLLDGKRPSWQPSLLLDL